MATSLQPDQQAPSGTPDNSQPSASSPASPSESSSPTTPQTPPPAAQPTDRYTQLLEASMREQNARIQAQNQEIQQLRQSQQAAPAAAPAQADPASFFNDPHGELEKHRRAINEDLQRTVAPLLELARGLRGDGTPYGNLKQQFQNDPRYSQTLADPKVAFAVDKIMENQQPTPDMMKAAIIQAAGLKMTGELDVALVQSGVDMSRFNTQSAPAPQPPAPVPSVPAHMRPTAPAAPVPQQATTEQEPLTALEQRIMRERKMTEEQYREWLKLPDDQVASSTIGRPAK